MGSEGTRIRKLSDVEHIAGPVEVAEQPVPPPAPTSVISIFCDKGDGFCAGLWYSAP